MNEKCWYKEVCKNKKCDGCIRYLEMSHLMENSGIPVKRQKPIVLSCDDVDREAYEELADIKADIENFVENGENLYIMGAETGNGKTSWALKLLMKYFDCIWAGNGLNIRGYFVHVPTFLNTLKDFNVNNDKLKSIIQKADLVVWDDIAATKLSDYDVTQLLSFIDTRMYNQLSNIYTGNIVYEDEFEKILGARLTSRIWSGAVIELRGKDRRYNG